MSRLFSAIRSTVLNTRPTTLQVKKRRRPSDTWGALLFSVRTLFPFTRRTLPNRRSGGKVFGALVRVGGPSVRNRSADIARVPNPTADIVRVPNPGVTSDQRQQLTLLVVLVMLLW